MDQLTVVLPFALPPPEMVPDLLRALQAPALAALISRTSTASHHPFDNATRVLPHEAWLADALGLAGAPGSDSAGPAFGAAAQRGFGHQAQDGYWFMVHPVHVQVSRQHLTMADPRGLGLDEADSRALFEAAKPYFDEIGKPLNYGDATTWLVRADDWAGLRTASPDAAIGQNLAAWMPEGERALATRKLQNEVQMLWFDHPANLARQERGQAPVNAYWLWAGAKAPAPALATPLFVNHAATWLTALAEPARRGLDASAILSQAGRANLVIGALAGAGLGGDWSHWLMLMQELESAWFAPLLAAVKSGQLGQLKLVLSHRDAWAEFDTSKNAQRKFWRTPTLKKLAP